MSADTLIARLRKNEREEVVIALRSYQGHDFVDIRTFFGLRGQETKPTQKGVTIPVELYREFRRLIEQLDDLMDDNGWG